MQITAIQLHTREQVEAILDEARDIADARTGGNDGWEKYFAAAVSLLGARHVIETQQQSVPIGLTSLLPGGR